MSEQERRRATKNETEIEGMGRRPEWVSEKARFGQIMSRIWQKDKRNKTLAISHVFL